MRSGLRGRFGREICLSCSPITSRTKRLFAIAEHAPPGRVRMAGGTTDDDSNERGGFGEADHSRFAGRNKSTRKSSFAAKSNTTNYCSGYLIMLRHGFVACAQAVAVDKFTNLVSVFYVLDALRPLAFPTWIPGLSFVAIVHRDDGDENTVEGHLVVRSGQHEVARSPVRIDFQDSLGFQMVINLQGVNVPTAGDLEFHLDLPGLNDCKYFVRVFAPPAQAPSAQAPLISSTTVQPR